MKVIEQAAKEYADRNVKRSDIEFLTVSQRDIHDYIQDAVHYGVQFAQRWINVEDDLPNTGELVQVVVKEFFSNIEYYDHDRIMDINGTKIFESEQSVVKVIKWRPINIE